MPTVKSILNPGRSKKALGWPKMKVYEALERMAKHNLGALLVMKNKTILGIFSERDYARKVMLENRTSRDTTLEEVMSTQIWYVGPNTSLDECMAIMSSKRVKHLPVIDSNGQLIDFIAMKDVVDGVVSEKDCLISQLTGYINGTYLVYPASKSDSIAS